MIVISMPNLRKTPENLLTARFIFGHFVPAIGSRKSPPKAGSVHALMDSRNMHTRGATPFVDVYIFCKSYGFLTPGRFNGSLIEHSDTDNQCVFVQFWDA